MCDRFSFSLSKEKTIRRFSVKVSGTIPQQYNVSPGHRVGIITQAHPRQLVWAVWGIQTTRQTPMHRLPIQTSTGALAPQAKGWLPQRCLILADGLYIWKKVSQRSRVPHRVVLKWNVPFAMAGVYTGNLEEDSLQCALLTTAANPVLEPFTRHMPLILPLEKEKSWLEENALAHWNDFVQPYAADQLRIFPVSTQINQKEANHPELTQPTQPVDQFGNYVLFD